MILAAMNKCLAQSNKSCTGREATKKRQMQIGCLLGDAAARVSDLRNHSANPRGGHSPRSIGGAPETKAPLRVGAYGAIGSARCTVRPRCTFETTKGGKSVYATPG